MMEQLALDSGTVMGGGGLTMGGFLLATLWRYLKRQEKLQDAQEELAKAQLRSIDAENAHREAERSYWRMVEHTLSRQTETLKEIHSELRPHTPVKGIRIEEPDEPPPQPRRHSSWPPRDPRGG